MGALPDVKVRVIVRDDNDPDFAVPVQVHCPQCPGWALLQQCLVGYAYICQMCSAEIPIIVVSPQPQCVTCGEPLEPNTAHIHFAPPITPSGTEPAG